VPDLAPGLHENLLRQVVGKRFVATAASHERSNPRLSTPHEFSKGGTIALGRKANNERFRTLGVITG
jgi:hypothetical protein